MNRISTLLGDPDPRQGIRVLGRFRRHEMNRSLFFESLLCCLVVIKDSAMLLGVAGLAENLFQSGAVLSALAGGGFLLLACALTVVTKALGGSK